ncbi:ESSS subunit of NADH:ubiquinone oxidoreductase-domain-containing protein [Jimgerdemannia flammicorona]|uniref:NADH dehydrogenase [ubiquinone] 1 beta subcomplex subunit 11, mitochondrial n=1 Tax=Jimgerdemannia flammicorona TaxID=994334 RepID=A0A433D0Y4_9FUNG|nr:ESSS subunit of NADH:ubiquinone oxidoreductase-domain-containing protein [Jimgerdemannia flammicorona]
MSAITKLFRPIPFRRLTTTNLCRSANHGHGHDDHHAPRWNEPGGYLFNEKPPAPGQKRVKEDWEDIYYWGMGGGFVLAGVMLYYKPDTSLVTWATREAEKSLQEKGVSLDYPKGD